MIFLIWYIIAIFVVILILKFYENIRIVGHHAPVIDKKSIVGYKKRFKIMNHTESALFFELRKQLPQDYYIFPNMRIADVIDAVNGPGFYKRRNKILPRHIDFVICDQNFKPIVAIELNGSSHNRLDRITMDKEKQQIFKEADLPLITIKVGHNFYESVSNILPYLKS